MVITVQRDGELQRVQHPHDELSTYVFAICISATFFFIFRFQWDSQVLSKFSHTRPKTSASAISHSGRVVTQRGLPTVFRYFFLFTTNMSDEPNPKIQLKITFEGQSKGYKSPSLLKLRT